MKRLGIYFLIVICIMACRKEKSGIRISGEDFLNQVFPTYTFHDLEYSKLVYALGDYVPDPISRYKNQIDSDITWVPVQIEANFGNQFYTRIGMTDSFNKLMKENYWELEESARAAEWNNHLIQYLDQGHSQFFRNYPLQKDPHALIYFPTKQHNNIARCSFDRPIFNEAKDKALLQDNYTVNNVKSMDLIYTLIKVEGRWKVLDYELVNYYL